MSPVDVEAFLAIKRQIVRARWLQAGVVSVALIGAIAAVLLVSRGDREATNLVLGFTIAAGVFSVVGSRAEAARDRLVELVEKQINRDPEALRYLAQEHPSR
jgi:hypothetical protein